MPPVKPSLRAIRVAKGLKIGQLAALVPGLKTQHLANCESAAATGAIRSGHTMSVELATSVAAVLEVPVAEIIEIAERQPAPKREPKAPPKRQETERTTAPRRATNETLARSA